MTGLNRPLLEKQDLQKVENDIQVLYPFGFDQTDLDDEPANIPLAAYAAIALRPPRFTRDGCFCSGRFFLRAPFLDLPQSSKYFDRTALAAGCVALC